MQLNVEDAFIGTGLAELAGPHGCRVRTALAQTGLHIETGVFAGHASHIPVAKLNRGSSTDTAAFSRIEIRLVGCLTDPPSHRSAIRAGIGSLCTGIPRDFIWTCFTRPIVHHS